MKIKLNLTSFIILILIIILISSIFTINIIDKIKQKDYKIVQRLNDIEFYNNKIIINEKNLEYTKVLCTGSMLPLIDCDSIILIKKINSTDILNVSDIVIINKSDSKNTILHRIIKVKEDNKGFYFVTKGDNNLFNDFLSLIIVKKVRIEDLESVVVGILK